MNLAMILEDIGIPYIVTDYMGFDWSDISRVDDKVRWKNIVQVRPPMVEFNRAVVDFFVLEKWESAVMIMPENPKDNQGERTKLCQHHTTFYLTCLISKFITKVQIDSWKDFHRWKWKPGPLDQKFSA